MLNKTKRGEERTWTFTTLSHLVVHKKSVSEWCCEKLELKFTWNFSSVILLSQVSSVSIVEDGWDFCGFSIFPFCLFNFKMSRAFKEKMQRQAQNFFSAFKGFLAGQT